MYDPNKSTWIFVDPNELPSIATKDEDLLAEYVLKAFTQKEKVHLYSTLYSTTKSKKCIEQDILSWQQQCKLNKIKKNSMKNSLISHELEKLIEDLVEIPSIKIAYNQLKSSLEQAKLTFHGIVKSSDNCETVEKEGELFINFAFRGVYGFLSTYTQIKTNTAAQHGLVDLLNFQAKACESYSKADTYLNREKIISEAEEIVMARSDGFKNYFKAKKPKEELTLPNSNFGFFLPKLDWVLEKINNAISPGGSYFY